MSTSPNLSSPWKQFLTALDAKLSERVELHCIGGFVACFFYGLPRITGDIDYYTAIPAYVDLQTSWGRIAACPTAQNLAAARRRQYHARSARDKTHRNVSGRV